MDSDSTKASVESIQDNSKCIDISNEPNLTGTFDDSSVHEEGVNLSVEGIDVAASEIAAPEPLSPVGKGESTVCNSVAKISDVVEEHTSVDVVSSELSPAVTEVGGGEEEENGDFKVQERDSMDLVASMVGDGGEEERAASIDNEGDFAAEGNDSTLNGGDIDSEQANLSLEEIKEVSMEEETPSHHLSVSEVNGVDSLKAEDKIEEGEQVVSGGMVDDGSSQAIESELGQNTESGNDKVDMMEEETTAQAASLVNDIEMPDEKVVASVAGFTEIPTQDKGLEDSVLNSGSEFVEEDPLRELQIGEGAKDVTDGEAKEDVDATEDAVDIQVLKKSEEEEKVDAASVLEIETKPQEVDVTVNAMDIQVLKRTEEEGKVDDVVEIETKPQEVDDVATEVSEKNEDPVDISSAVVTEFSGETQNTKETVIDDVKEDVEKDPEAGKSVDIHVQEAAEVEADVKYGAGIEKEDDGMGGAGEAGQTVDLEETRELSEELAKVDETKISELPEETETMVGDENQEKDDDIADVAEDVETHGDSSVADIEETREDHEDMGMTETQEETVKGKVNRKNIAEVSEETETMIKGEDQEKDDEMNDVAEDVETHGDSPVADIEEGKENNEEMGLTELTEKQEESVMAEMEDEEPEEIEEEEKSAGGKRKRVRSTKTVKGTGKKKEEDVCFICFDGGDLVLCDRRGCPKAYHPSCVNRDEAFFQSKGKWNCGWHLCSKCEKTATYLCYTCTFSLCKGCAKDDVFFCIRGNKGLCETCMETVKLMERKEQEKEPAQMDFDDKTSWEYLFKDYWIDLKTQLSLSPEELDQAKSPQKGHGANASKQGTATETDYVTDGGSDSDSSPKKRKTRSRSKSASAEKTLSPADKNLGETIEWASKELLDLVVHMRRGDRSFVPQSEVQNLLLQYIKRYNLRDPRRKSQVICDSRLQNLFGKSNVGHFEMLNLLESHFLNKEQNQADDIEGDIVDTEELNHVDVDENLDHPMKSGKDKKRKTRKKGVRKGRQSNLDDFAAVDTHNINLIYLRRSLVEDLLEDSTAFEEKVASAFVRLRISGNQKQDIYRLVQVVGTSKAPESYKVGKKTTDFVLEILNLDKTEVISIDIISNQDFTEDECKRLKQSIKCGLINRLTVGDIQEKAIALQEVRIKNLLEAEIVRFSHLRDRASDMGRRKELRECVEKLQLLKSPEERQRRLEEIPEIHADPKMDPDCESEDEDEKEEKEKEKQLRPRSSSYNRRGREPISPRKGGFSSNESWSGTSNYSNTSANRELSRSYSGRGSRGDYLGSSDDKVSDSMWTSGREREMQQSLVSEKLRSVSIPETTARSSRAVAPPELSPRIASEIATAPPAVAPQPVPRPNESEKIWHYKDPSGKVQGPFSMAQLRKWNNTGYFPAKLEIWKANESPLDSILLTDALAGLFQKQTQAVDNSYMKAQVAEPNLGSTARTAPSILDIPRNSRDNWSSGGSLPSPTPNQISTPTAKRRNFESRWSPTKASPQSAIQSMNYSVGQSGQSQASRIDIPVALQPQTHPFQTPDSINVSVNHSATFPSPTREGGKQSWGSMQTDKFDSHGHRVSDAPVSQNSSYGNATPSVLPSQSQPGFPPSDPWKVAISSQPNVQAQAPAPGNNVPWGMNMVNNQNSGQPQAPANQNSSWGQGTVNPNMGWVGPVQAGMNANWAAAPSVPPTGQGMPNSGGWGGPVQGQPQAYPNTGWGVTNQAQGQPQSQAQVSNTGSGWMQPGQGMQSGNSNQNWGTQNLTAMPSGGSGGNQGGGLWGNQQNQNGDSGYGWNRQSSGQNNNFKGQRVCKFFREDGYCRKGASCNYLH